MTYDKQELIDSVKSEIESAIKFRFLFSEESEEKELEIRLQLIDESYYFHSGDSQYDNDHRGQWGYECLTFDDSGDCVSDINELAESMVTEALEMWEEERSEEVSKTHPLQNSEAYSYEFHSYGALTIYCNGEDVGYLQGDEAYDLKEQLENTHQNWELQTILEQYHFE